MSIRIRHLVAASLLVLCSATSYSSLATWNVQPKVCIVEKLGASCEMELEIQLSPLNPGRYCYYQDSELLQCWPHDNPITVLRVKFSKATVLYLKDQQKNTIFQHELDIKAREISQKTRRVRQPWSLF